MTTEDKFTIIVTLRNGQLFEHQHPREPELEVRKFIMEIIGEMQKQQSGILTLPFPLGVYRMDDVSSIRFLDIESDAKIVPIGFQPKIPATNRELE